MRLRWPKKPPSPERPGVEIVREIPLGRPDQVEEELRKVAALMGELYESRNRDDLGTLVTLVFDVRALGPWWALLALCVERETGSVTDATILYRVERGGGRLVSVVEEWSWPIGEL